LLFTTALFYKAAAILAQQNNSDLDAEFTLLIDAIKIDFIDGQIENPSLLDTLRKANNRLNPTIAIENLSRHSEQVLGTPHVKI